MPRISVASVANRLGMSTKKQRIEPVFLIDGSGHVHLDASTPTTTGVYIGAFSEFEDYSEMDDFICLLCREPLQDDDRVFVHRDNFAAIFHVDDCLTLVLELADPNWIDNKFEHFRENLVDHYEKNPLATPKEDM